jgi:glutamate 5-kinase
MLVRHGCHAAQILLTADDLNDRTRYLNVRNTLLSLLRFGTLPIINENDTVSVEELMTTFGDNDRLAAMVSTLLRASLLIIFSDVDGLYDGDPSLSGSRLVATVTTIDDKIQSFVRDRKTGLSKGGMASKLEAARIVTTGGESVIIANGHTPGEAVGTLFVPQSRSLSPLQRWIGFSARPRGKVIVDEGACKAITRQGKSLLAAGIVDTEGDFRKGDVVNICDRLQTLVARGLSNYSASDVQRIRGLKSTRIAQVLGYRPYEEVVHRDNLAVVGG